VATCVAGKDFEAMSKSLVQSVPPARSATATVGWLIALVLVAARVLPWLLRPGMFFDGVIYATISRNMAVGIGDAWHLVFSTTQWPDFHEAPPLAFVLESLLFRLLGDHFWVEKLYSVLTGLATAVMIAAIWRRLVDFHAPWRHCSWLPVLLWLILPGWMTVYGNNLLEGTMGLFAILAVYAALRADEGGRAACAWLPLAAASVVAALLSKGPVGLYPLATPILAGLTLRRQSLGKSVAMNAALVGLVCGLLGLVFLQAGALESFTKYLHVQVFAALAGDRSERITSSLGQFYIFREIVRELAVPAAVAGALILRSRRRSLANSSDYAAPKRALAFCLLTAVSASFPIAISPKQENWYSFPSYPFYALALALWCAPALARVLAASKAAVDDWSSRLLKRAAICTLLILIGIVCHALLHIRRDQDLYLDTLALARVVPKSSVVSFKGFSDDVHSDAAVPCYFARWAYASVEQTEPREFLVLPIAGCIQPPRGYQETPTGMRLYRLFKRSDSMNLVMEPVGRIGSIRVSDAIEPSPRHTLSTDAPRQGLNAGTAYDVGRHISPGRDQKIAL
jgi:hypothetical protein